MGKGEENHLEPKSIIEGTWAKNKIENEIQKLIRKIRIG